MRLSCLLGLVLVLSGISVAQQMETNFPVGPQYLIPEPPPLILQPIQTPSMQPWEPYGVTSPQTGEAGPVMITVPADLPAIYWGAGPPAAVAVPVPVPVPSGLPPDYIDLGVSAIATPAWLHQHDSGMSLAQVAQYWKAQHLHATHVYTNADIERMNRQ